MGCQGKCKSCVKDSQAPPTSKKKIWSTEQFPDSSFGHVAQHLLQKH